MKRILLAAVLCAGISHDVRAEVSEDIQTVSQRLDCLRSTWTNSVYDAYVAGTNLFWDVHNMTNGAWRATCASNCLDTLVTLPHVSYTMDMLTYTNYYFNPKGHYEEDFRALEIQFGMLWWGRSWLGDIVPDYVHDSAFTLAEIWRRESDLQLKAYEKVAITNWNEYYKNAQIAYFTNQQNRAQWKRIHALINERYSTNLVRESHVHSLAYKVNREICYFFDVEECQMRQYYRSATPERRAYIRRRLTELLGGVPGQMEAEERRLKKQEAELGGRPKDKVVK